jgi:predicted aspartyl protease
MARSRIAGALFVVAAAAFAADPPPDSIPKLSSPAGHYSLKLSALITPQSAILGLYFKARIDGGPVLRMLLDSGAQHILLDKGMAGKLGRTVGSGLELVGVGSASNTGRHATRASLQIGNLVLDGCDILVVNGQIEEGVDGIVPMSLFAGFLVHLDVSRKVLELDGYPSDPPAQDAGYLPVRTDHQLLFLHTVVNESQPGYVLLDTGATYNALSPEAARASRNYWSLTNAIDLRGAAGGTEGFPLPPGVRFRWGARVLSADPAVVLDLSNLARHHQFEIAGILGYPALRNSIVTIDYRDSLVRIEGK